MMDEATFIKFVAVSTQEECRIVGEQLIALSHAPRGVEWKSKFAAALLQLPPSLEDGIAETINAGRARVQERDNELRATGWHPDQMRAKLKELGYAGNTLPTPI